MKKPVSPLLGHHRYDVSFKSLMHIFRHSLSDFLGADPPFSIANEDEREYIFREGNKEITSAHFLLNSGEGLHVEFQELITRENLYPAVRYVVNIHEKKRVSQVRSYIITLQEPQEKSIGGKTISYNPAIVDLSQRSAEETIESIQWKIQNKEKVNPLDLCFLPLYSSSRNLTEVLVEALSLVTNCIPDHEIAKRVRYLMIGEVGQRIGVKERKELKKVIKMGVRTKNLAEDLCEEWFQEGIECGINRGVKIARISAASKAIQEGLSLTVVSTITELPINEVSNLAEMIT